jgi:hypothetical protein
MLMWVRIRVLVVWVRIRITRWRRGVIGRVGVTVRLMRICNRHWLGNR